jgi:hypothetical protein
MPTPVQSVDIPLPPKGGNPRPVTRGRVYNHPPDWKPYKYKKPSKWDKHQFICYDGEGYDINGRHEYVYLCAYDGADYMDIRNDAGLTTEQSIKFLLSTAKKYKYGINVIYGGSYDANMILKDLSYESLYQLHHEGEVLWRDYRIEYIARKYFQVSYIKNRKITIRLWDVIGFFQSSFEASLEAWLDVKDQTIAKGKKSRAAFNAKQLDFIIAYCQKELYLFEQLMQRLWQCLNAAGIKLNRWDGAGAASSFLLRANGVYEHKGSPEVQAAHYHLARAAYAGGRFELFRPGDFRCKVYNYDINSAYPYGMTQLPAFTGMVECRRKDHSKCIIGKYDLVKVDYEGSHQVPIHPYFHRDNNYSISYPLQHKGWHWAPEYLVAQKYGMQGNIDIHYKLPDNKVRPFYWVGTLYDKRRALKASGDKAEKALKLALNALYGKLVQQKGWKPGKSIPVSHQLYWGGWITALTRSMIFDAMMQNPDCIIAAETDGIFCTEKLDLPLGEALGEWEVKEYDSLTYVQSGMYFGTLSEGYYNPAKPQDREVVKYRGLDKGSLKREHIITGWEKFTAGGPTKVKGKSTRFRTIGTSLVGDRMADWRQWMPDKKEITLLPTGKRLHNPLCKEHWGIDGRHTTIAIQPKNEESVAYNVLWEDMDDKLMMFNVLEEEWEGIVREN